MCDSAFHQTQQIILYETSNMIDINIAEKSYCSGWDSGWAIEGIQNATGTVAYTVPGRNATQWTAVNDAWRFTPAGPPDYSINWYQGSALVSSTDTLVACTDTITTYVAIATLNNCDGGIVILQDSVIVTPSSGTLSIVLDSVQNSLCVGGLGCIYIHGVGSGEIQYIWSTGESGNSLCGVTTGIYGVTAYETGGCSVSGAFAVAATDSFGLTLATDQNVSCNGGNDGILDFIPSGGGVAPFVYEWTNGANTQAIENLGVGTYCVTAIDVNGCAASACANISQPAPLGLSFTQSGQVSLLKSD